MLHGSHLLHLLFAIKDLRSYWTSLSAQLLLPFIKALMVQCLLLNLHWVMSKVQTFDVLNLITMPIIHIFLYVEHVVSLFLVTTLFILHVLTVLLWKLVLNLLIAHLGILESVIVIRGCCAWLGVDVIVKLNPSFKQVVVLLVCQIASSLL